MTFSISTTARLHRSPALIKSWIGNLFRWSKGLKALPFSPETAPAATSLAEDAEKIQPTIQLPDTARLIRSIKAAQTGLMEICRKTESDFLDLGGLLQTTHSEARELTQNIMATLSDEHGESIESALSVVQTHASEALGELEQGQTELGEDLLQLGSIHADLCTLLDKNNLFKQVAKNLKMVGLNISIESSRQDDEKQSFQTLAEEIAELAQTVHGVVNDIRDDADNARRNIDAIQSEIEGRMQHLGSVMNSARNAVGQSLEEVDHLMQVMVQSLDRISAGADEIGEQVGQLVISIQIHDNISQRVAHIESAMDEVVEMIDTASALDLPVHGQMAVLGKAYGITHLQVTQVKTVVRDIAKVRQTCETALDNLLGAVAAVARPDGIDMSVRDGEGRSQMGTHHHTVVRLENALEQLIALLDEGGRDIERLNEARNETGKAISRMDEHLAKVADVNFDIRLKALNAVVKSGRLGEAGRAIAAIVNEIKSLAAQSGTTIGAVSDIMESITSASTRLDRGEMENAAGESSAAGQLRQGIDSFTVACSGFRQGSAEAFDLGQQLETKIGQSRHHILFFESLLSAFNHGHDQLVHVLGQLEPFAEEAPQDWIDEEKAIIARYTMQSERDAHFEAYGGDSAKRKSDPEATIVRAETVERFTGEENAPDEELGDNIELF